MKTDEEIIEIMARARYESRLKRNPAGGQMPYDRARLMDLDQGERLLEEREFLSALRAAGMTVIQDWSTDMEKAPRDGSKFLIFSPCMGYELAEYCVHEIHHFEEVGDGLFQKMVDEPYIHWNSNFGKDGVCHWAPLLPPPLEIAHLGIEEDESDG